MDTRGENVGIFLLREHRRMLAPMDIFKAGGSGRGAVSPWGACAPAVGAERGTGGRGRVGSSTPRGIICGSAAVDWMLGSP